MDSFRVDNCLWDAGRSKSAWTYLTINSVTYRISGKRYKLAMARKLFNGVEYKVHKTHKGEYLPDEQFYKDFLDERR